MAVDNDSNNGGNLHDEPQPTEPARVMAVDKVPFTIDHLLAHLQIEADFVVDRAVVTRGQRLVLRDMLQRAHDEIERLNDENEALRIDLAAAYAAWTTWKD